MDNLTERLPTGQEIYTNELDYLADEFLQEYFCGDMEEMLKKRQFPHMIIYIHDRLKDLPTTDEIEKLDALFEAYYRLCLKFSYLPTLALFSDLVGISNCTFSDWARGDYRAKQVEYSKSVKKWRKMCENQIESKLTNEPGANPNLMFVAKANFGWSEDVKERQETKKIESSSAYDLPVFTELEESKKKFAEYQKTIEQRK